MISKPRDSWRVLTANVLLVGVSYITAPYYGTVGQRNCPCLHLLRILNIESEQVNALISVLCRMRRHQNLRLISNLKLSLIVEYNSLD